MYFLILSTLDGGAGESYRAQNNLWPQMEAFWPQKSIFPMQIPFI
jgi:hypothetical protein